MKLFSGTSNLALSKKIAENLHIPLSDVEITRFIDNECRVYVKEEVCGEDVFVVQSLSEIADQHLVELCLLGTALKDLGAKKITAVIPWLGYSKQDKAFRKGEAISASLVAKFIEVAGFDNVITCELHSQKVLQYFHIPVVELSTEKLFGQYHGIVVSPDKGGKSRSEIFAKEAGLPIVYLTKKREGINVTMTGMSGSVSGVDCIIFDDIINTGATAVQTSKFLKKHGAKRIYFFVTHAVLAGDAAKKLDASSIDQIVVTDTIFVPKEKQFPKLTIVSVASVIADSIIKQ